MSTRTPNINLEKPSSDENYSISVFNGNSDTIDTEVALRVKTSDIINNLTSTATNKPLSAAQGKKLQDEKVAISSIVNNLTSTATNAPLSAAQGKSLSDTKANKTEVVPNTQNQITNLDAISNYPSGEHKVHHGWFNSSATGTKPFGDGHVDTYVWRNVGGTSDYITQVAYEDDSFTMLMRAYNRNSWSDWAKIATQETGTWTAHIYDFDTKLFEVANQAYWKIGSIYICRLDIASFPSSNFATMFQVRNLPCDYVLGGTIYVANSDGQFGNKTIQTTNAGRVYIRPNFTGSISGGICTGMFIGY